MTGRAAEVAALAALAARRVELFEAALASADAAAARAPKVGRAPTRFRRRDTRREDAARARAVALDGLQRARRVEAAAAEELANEALPLLEAEAVTLRGHGQTAPGRPKETLVADLPQAFEEANPGGRPRKEHGADLPHVSEVPKPEPKAATR